LQLEFTGAHQRRGVDGRKLGGGKERCYGRLAVALGEGNLGPSGWQAGRLWLKRGCLGQRGLGSGEVAAFGQCAREIDAGDVEAGVQRQCGAIVGDGGVGVAGRAGDVAQQVMRPFGIGVVAQREASGPGGGAFGVGNGAGGNGHEGVEHVEHASRRVAEVVRF
jgi:hypothetical protein